MSSIVADALKVAIELELLSARAYAAGHTGADPELVVAAGRLQYIAEQIARVAKRLAPRGRPTNPTRATRHNVSTRKRLVDPEREPAATIIGGRLESHAPDPLQRSARAERIPSALHADGRHWRSGAAGHGIHWRCGSCGALNHLSRGFYCHGCGHPWADDQP